MALLRWATELGRVDILHEIAILSQFQASPKVGHMNELLHIFAYLKKKPKLTIYMNPQRPMILIDTFKVDPTSFHEMSRDATEESPFNAPIPRGQSVMVTAFVDSSHGSNKVTCRSHMGYIIFVNRAPILWYSKHQNTVEASTFSSEFIALKVWVEAIVGL